MAAIDVSEDASGSPLPSAPAPLPEPVPEPDPEARHRLRKALRILLAARRRDDRGSHQNTS